MSEHTDALARVRDGTDVIKISRPNDRTIFVEAEFCEDDPEIVETFNIHVRDNDHHEMPYYYQLDGLGVLKTLNDFEYRVVPRNQMTDFSDEF